MEISFIFQGPIKSNGVNFESQKEVKFDCYELLIRNIKLAKMFSRNIILSTYHNELSQDKIYYLEQLGVEVIISKPIEPITIKNFRKINTLSQFFSVLVGINFLIENEFNGYVIKIRTDISLDFKNLIEDVKNATSHKRDILLIPYFIRTKRPIERIIDGLFARCSKYKFYMLDFFFAANINLLKELIEIGLEKKLSYSGHKFLLTSFNSKYNYSKNIHYYEVQWWKSINKPILRRITYYSLQIATLRHKKIFNTLIYNNVFPCSFKTVSTLVWRGSSYDSWINKNKVNFEFLDEYIV